MLTLFSVYGIKQSNKATPKIWPLFRNSLLWTDKRTVGDLTVESCRVVFTIPVSYFEEENKNDKRKTQLTNPVEQETEGSSPHSPQPAAGPCPEPAESNPHPQANLPKIHSDPIFPLTSLSSRWSLSFRISHQNLVLFSLLSHACYMPRPPHPPWLDLPNDIWGWVQIMKFLIVQLPPFPRHLIPLRSKYSSQNPVLKHP
jgi:hypothetical protein